MTQSPLYLWEHDSLTPRVATVKDAQSFTHGNPGWVRSYPVELFASPAADRAEVPALPDHPENQTMRWSRLEEEAIARYGRACYEAGALARSTDRVRDGLLARLDKARAADAEEIGEIPMVGRVPLSYVNQTPSAASTSAQEEEPDHDCALKRGGCVCRECDLNTIAATQAPAVPAIDARAEPTSAFPNLKLDGWFLPFEALNEPMRAKIRDLIAHAKRGRWSNAIVRKDGKETTYEADWIKLLIPFGDAALTQAASTGGKS